MAETIFILGCGTMQVPALRIAREMGWKVCAADGNPSAEGRPFCDRFFHVDLKDVAGLIEAAREISRDGGLDGVFTAGTDFSLSVAMVAEALGLPGHSPDAARLATDKVAMRRRFQEAGAPSPAFAEVGPDDDPLAAVTDVPGPWVVKPVDSMGARGVIRIDETGGLAEALREARSFSRSGRALLETYIEGPEYSLDALVEDGKLIRCGLADRHIVYPPCFIEVGHTIPSRAGSDEADIIWDAFEKGIQALGLSRGAAKGDLKLSADGPMIGEIAARLSGGYMSGWTFPYASGIEPTRGALRLAVGLNAAVPDACRNLICAERALIGIDGRVRMLNGADRALELPGVREAFLRYQSGDQISFPRNNVEKVGNVIVTGETVDEAHNRARAALRTLNLELDPDERCTGQYLDASGPFPPDAFEFESEENPSGHISVFTSYLQNLWSRNPPVPSRGCSGSVLRISVPAELEKTSGQIPEDFAGRTPLDILRILAGEGRIVILPEADTDTSSETLLSDFWKALVRGGLPGARWYLEHCD